MGKIKSHKATAKRFSLTKSGKAKLNHQFRRHKLGKKTTKRKRALRVRGYMANAAQCATIRRLIPYAD